MTRHTYDRQQAFEEGRREFPEDLTGAELVRDEILGTITREGHALLTGKREFPDNQVAAELVRDEVLGSLTEEEREILAELRRNAKDTLAA